MTFVEAKKKVPDGRASFFTCATTAYQITDGKEFIAVANSIGEIFSIEINGSSFTKQV